MTKQKKKDIAISIGIATICVLFIFQIGSCTCSCGKREVAKQTAKAKVRAAVKAEIESHYPKRGEAVELNGEKIVILKKLYWKTERTYQVRMMDGTITNVMGSEIKDKPIIKEDPNNILMENK